MYLLNKILKLRWLPARYWFYLRQAMQLKVNVRDPADGLTYSFLTNSLHSYQRAHEYLDKEPETIKWLRDLLRSDDVFLDIGANVGTFSIFAAKHISQRGHVYACEPHLPTTVQLLQNISVNNLENYISVISIAASGEDCFAPFRYKRWREGASGSQLGVDGSPEITKHVGVELKSGLRIDTLIEKGVMPAPNLIKIDTDGIEIQILKGMERLLSGTNKPRSILVEVQEGKLVEQDDLMKNFGYSRVASYVMGKSKRLLDQGHELNELPFNAVFEPI
jgi:FkbM family methyltransferase